MEKQKEIYGVIYVIRNKINNKLYIGQTTNKKGFNGRYHFKGNDIERVYKSHKYDKEHGRKYNSHLLNAIEEYGFNNFEVDKYFDIAYSEEELNKLEYMYIKIYQCTNKKYGYNNREGGNNGKLSEETKQRISKANKGKFIGENSPNYGKHLTEETKQKISKANKGRLKGEKHPFYGKTGENSVNYGKHHSEETRKKMSKANKGRILTEEWKNKVSETRKQKEVAKGYKNPSAKAVFCYEFNEIRLTAKEWSIKLNIDLSSIIKCCKEKYKSAKGYHFRYATEEEIKEYKLKHGID